MRNYSNNFCLMQSFFQTFLYEVPHRHMFYIKLFLCIFLLKMLFSANIFPVKFCSGLYVELNNYASYH